MAKDKSTEIEVGKEILSFCGKCKEPTNHIITSLNKKGGADKRECQTCKALHKYRDPEKVKKAGTRRAAKKTASAAEVWNEAMAAAKGAGWFGSIAEAIAAVDTAFVLAEDPDQFAFLRQAAQVYAGSGERDRALAILDQLRQREETEENQSCFPLLQYHLGNVDEMFACLKRKYETEGPEALSFLWPAYRKYRDDPRFQELAALVNFPFEGVD